MTSTETSSPSCFKVDEDVLPFLFTLGGTNWLVGEAIISKETHKEWSHAILTLVLTHCLSEEMMPGMREEGVASHCQTDNCCMWQLDYCNL